MIELPRILAIVPARGGSKRIPRKNLIPLGGRPLIHWTIEAARTSCVCDEVLVSTDDKEIAELARDAGATVPWLRPADLATDTARSSDVIAHALDWYEKSYGAVDAVLLLQPTNPFRSAASIRGAVRIYADQPGPRQHPVVSVSPAASHPAWTFTCQGAELKPCFGWEPLTQRSQDLPPAYALNGAVYVIPAEDARAALPIVRPGLLPYVMTSQRESLDIDTEEDWAMALFWVNNGR